MKKYLFEFIGTFFLVLTIGMAVIDPVVAVGFAPLAVGSALMIMIYAGGHVSGAHYNPAVTLAVWLRGRCATADVLPYWIAQILGAAAAAFVVLYLKGNPSTLTPREIERVPALIAETIGTFALCYVILNVATAKATAGNSNYGLAIGFTVTAMAYALSGVSNSVFNPAVAVGGMLMHLVKASNLWLYLVANFGAGVLAALVFKFTHPEDK
jgi:aquaporin Z